MDTSDEERTRYREAFVHAQNSLGAANLILLNIKLDNTFTMETPLAKFMEEMLAQWAQFLGRAFTPEERRSFTLEQAVLKLMRRAMALTRRTVKLGAILGIQH
mgnify:CR=1 FL=1